MESSYDRTLWWLTHRVFSDYSTLYNYYGLGFQPNLPWKDSTHLPSCSVCYTGDMKREVEFQTMWHHLLESYPPHQPEVYELKLCKTNRFPFSSVKTHQIIGLLKADTGLFHKISDAPIFSGMKTRFTAKKPFDCLWIKAKPFVCILFYVPRKPKLVIKIDICSFIDMRDNSDKKSATFQDFVDYGCEVVKLWTEQPSTNSPMPTWKSFV